MGADTKQIVCRKCDNEFAVANGNCPRCGTAVRGYKGPGLAILVGIPMVAASLLKFEELYLFGLFGVLFVVMGTYFIKDRRDRLVDAPGDEG